MDKWILLFFTGVSGYALIETILWFQLMQKAPPEEIEKTIGYSSFGKSMLERTQLSNRFKHGPNGLSSVLIFMLVIFFTLSVASYRAFFP